MKFIYTTVINALLFFFMVNIFNGIRIGDGTVAVTIVAGLVFGVFIAAIPTILKFFKLPVTSASTFLVALIVIFIFLFLLYSQFLGMGSLTGTNVLLASGGARINLGAVQTMVAATVFTSLAVLGLEALSKQK